jgi:hypothetical protein
VINECYKFPHSEDMNRTYPITGNFSLWKNVTIRIRRPLQFTTTNAAED